MILPLVCWAGFTALLQPAYGEFISTDGQRYNEGKFGHKPQHHFYSSKEVSPVLQVNTWNKSAISDDGSHIFLRHCGSTTSSPLVLDARDLSTVYVSHASGFEHVYGTRVQENFGKKYLTFWAGKKDDGFGTSSGYGLAYDDTYRLVYNVSAHVWRHSDLHEFAFTGHGTALILAVDDVLVNTADWPEWEGDDVQVWARDNIIQEVDLETNELLFSWRALDHITGVDSFEKVGSYWDIFHTNSIQKTQAGNYLVSMRHTHSILLIDGETGDIIWTLGGKRNDFVELDPALVTSEGSPQADAVPPVLSMGWQHHARFVPGTNETELTLFDNHGGTTSYDGTCRATGSCSRGLRIAIDTTSSPPTVRLLQQHLHPAGLRSKNQGSTQPLPDGNTFVGWGHNPAFTEHLPTGEAVLDVQFAPWPSDDPLPLDNYRAYKMGWAATPWWPPAAAARETLQGDLDVFASWNGATGVREWVARGGDQGLVLARARRAGFETRLSVGPRVWAGRVWVEALDGDGTVLGTSEVLDLGGGVDVLREGQEEGVAWGNVDSLGTGSRGVVTAAFWLGAGLVGLAWVLVWVVRWRQRRDYAYIVGDSETDSDSEADDEDVAIALGDFGDGFHRPRPKAWDSFTASAPQYYGQCKLGD